MPNARHFKWWSTPARRPQNGHPKIELDQLGRQPLETCCKVSSITPGTTVAICLSDFMSTNVTTGNFWGLKIPKISLNPTKILMETLDSSCFFRRSVFCSLV